jgi:hypothetical protein
MTITEDRRHSGHYKKKYYISNWCDGKIKINSPRSLTGGFICVIPTALAIAPSAATELLEQNQTQLAKKLILPTLLDHDTASLVMRSATYSGPMRGMMKPMAFKKAARPFPW